MSDVILKKINEIECLLFEINSKLDNFLGFEELTAVEEQEIKKLRKEVKDGQFISYDEIFSK